MNSKHHSRQNKKKAIAIFPGTFDPLTQGHWDLVVRSYTMFDRFIIAVLDNPQKSMSFLLSERKEMIEELLRKENLNGHIEVLTFRGLLMDFAREVAATVIIRGIRALSDFDFEFRIARMNRHLDHRIETLFLLSSPEYEHISSSLVKEVFELGGDVSVYLPKNILEYLYSKKKK